jgi:hypothetical protein
MADCDNSIQGYADGVFWERNTLADQKTEALKVKDQAGLASIDGNSETQQSSVLPRRRGRPRQVKPDSESINLRLF